MFFYADKSNRYRLEMVCIFYIGKINKQERIKRQNKIYCFDCWYLDIVLLNTFLEILKSNLRVSSFNKGGNNFLLKNRIE